ncbi:uncharacterized protein CLUP02_09992 [Colletotrichum lupini]|uniref:Uncharacterized protein n=1 Tax=Colletotrichum lupini TaxID=145971 RepID=A0A9Q8SW17_9PEZI|nr:uncharacterized protein CLUP02_09992 [Colletotrichum lupini]UQC84495.1 hypothetical protein CLUP02_09992 [Colletotrichum lupini]
MAQAPAFFGDPGSAGQGKKVFSPPPDLPLWNSKLSSQPIFGPYLTCLPTNQPTNQPTDIGATTTILPLRSASKHTVVDSRHGPWQEDRLRRRVSNLSNFTLGPGIPADAFTAN